MSERERLIAQAVERISPQLRKRDFRFVPILRFDKRPFEHNWALPGGNNYQYDDPKLAGFILAGYNWGICTGFGDLVVFDSDAEGRLKELGIVDDLPETFSVRTGGGGIHRYYICRDHGDKIIMFDRDLVNAGNQPLHLGEVQTQGFQCVGPGSTHPNGNKYQVVNDVEVAEVKWTNIYDVIEAKVDFGMAEIKKSEPKLIRVKNPGMRDPFEDVRVEEVMRPTGKVRDRGSIISGSHPIHGSTGGHNFQIDTKNNRWHCFRCWSGGGSALAIAVKEGIISCSEAKPGVLRGELFLKTLEVAKERGYINASPLERVK